MLHRITLIKIEKYLRMVKISVNWRKLDVCTRARPELEELNILGLVFTILTVLTCMVLGSYNFSQQYHHITRSSITYLAPEGFSIPISLSWTVNETEIVVFEGNAVVTNNISKVLTFVNCVYSRLNVNGLSKPSTWIYVSATGGLTTYLLQVVIYTMNGVNSTKVFLHSVTKEFKLGCINLVFEVNEIFTWYKEEHTYGVMGLLMGVGGVCSAIVGIAGIIFRILHKILFRGPYPNPRRGLPQQSTPVGGDENKKNEGFSGILHQDLVELGSV
jgi:hypothetical protein